MTEDNLEQGIFTLKQLKLISAKYRDVYGDFISDDYISLFKINMRLKRNKEELLRLKPFHWAQFFPIFGKYIFIEKNGFTEEMRKKAENILRYYKPEQVEKFINKIG